MSVLVNPRLLVDLKRFGAFDVTACFNCGNCTAVCPLSSGDATFPRRIIRYGQIGARQQLISSKELWLCYYCGECSETCPREAEPGEYMASARRYAIASLDPTGISRWLYTSKLFNVLFLGALSLLLTVILLSSAGAMNLDRPNIFEFIPFEVVHDLGLVVILIAVFTALFGVLGLVRLLRAGRGQPDGSVGWRGMLSAIRIVAAELAAEKRYRICAEDEPKPWYRSRWFMHWAIMWGFIGLAAATTLDYLLLLLAEKVPGQPVPLWQPTRLLGTVTGVLVLFGTVRALAARFKKPDKYSSHSLASDWLFLWLILLGTLTGFIVEFVLYLPRGTVWGYIVFLVHVVLGMGIVLLFPFTKFAHAVYRPIALIIHELRTHPA